MKQLTSNQRLGNSIFKMRRTYARVIVAVGNFNKARDQRSAAYSMTEANRIHRLLSDCEVTYANNLRSDQAQIERAMARRPG